MQRTIFVSLFHALLGNIKNTPIPQFEVRFYHKILSQSGVQQALWLVHVWKTSFSEKKKQIKMWNMIRFFIQRGKQILVCHKDEKKSAFVFQVILVTNGGDFPLLILLSEWVGWIFDFVLILKGKARYHYVMFTVICSLPVTVVKDISCTNIWLLLQSQWQMLHYLIFKDIRMQANQCTNTLLFQSFRRIFFYFVQLVRASSSIALLLSGLPTLSFMN